MALASLQGHCAVSGHVSRLLRVLRDLPLSGAHDLVSWRGKGRVHSQQRALLAPSFSSKYVELGADQDGSELSAAMQIRHNAAGCIQASSHIDRHRARGTFAEMSK